MEVMPGYKQTDVGAIPEDWRVVAVEDIGTVGRGRVISHRDITRVRNPKYPIYSSQTSDDGVMGYIDTFDFEGEYITWTTDGANAGTVFARNGRFNCTNVCGTIKPTSDNYFFVARVLARFAPRHVSRHLGNPKLMNDIMKRVEIPLPSARQEQDAIATVLSDADALLSVLDRLIGKKRDLKHAAMQQLLTGQSHLPGFHGEWVVKKVADIANVTKGTQLHSSETIDEGQFPHFNGGISPSSYTDKANTTADTIAISEGGNSCGYVQLVRERFWCGGHCYALAPEGVDNRFLYHALKARQAGIMRLRVGSGLPNVQKTALKAFSVNLPSDYGEQVAIASILSDMDAELAALEAKRDKTRALTQAMLQELLTGKTRLVPVGAVHA